jgi:tryptophan halogenase
MVNRIVVVGGGSAGFLAAITLKATLKARMQDVSVAVIRSKSIGIIGVGEGTTVVVPSHLHGFLKLDVREFYEVAQPQWKLGIRFLWGKRPWFDYSFAIQLSGRYQNLPHVGGFYCDQGPFDYVGLQSSLMTHNKVFARGADGRPIIDATVAYHLENELFVTYLERQAARVGVEIIDGTIQELTQDDHGITGLRLDNQTTQTADLYVDASGFVSLLLGKTLGEPFESFKSSLFNDRAVVGSWQRGPEPIQPYTTAETMNSGWCWQIDHEHRIARGYVYSSAFITDEEAEREFRAKNPKARETRIVKFVTGKYARSWVKNVVGIGNSMGFVEPLESTSLSVICNESNWLAESLADCDRQPNETMRNQVNKRVASNWRCIRDFLAVHFRFNTRFDTPYWRECREKADLGQTAEILDYYRENGPSVLWRSTLLPPDDPFEMEGYMSMLVGMQVPCKSTYRPSDRDKAIWNQIRGIYQGQAMAAFSVNEAMAMVRSPQWQWPRIYG